MDIGGVIRKYRLSNNMEQKDLAKLLHVSDKTVSSWETNRTQPKMDIIEELCKIFHCKKSDFLEDAPIKFDSPEEFEFTWHQIGGGRHPLELTDEEHTLVTGYRMLKESDKAVIKRMIRILAYAKIFKRDDI